MRSYFDICFLCIHQHILPCSCAVIAPLFFLILISKTDLKHQVTTQKQFARNPQLCKKLTKNHRWYSGINSDTPVTGASIALCSIRCTNGHRTRFCKARFYSCRTVCTSAYFFNSHQSAFRKIKPIQNFKTKPL